MSVIEMQNSTSGTFGISSKGNMSGIAKTQREEDAEKPQNGAVQAPPDKQPREDSLELSADAQRYLDNNESEDAATASEAKDMAQMPENSKNPELAAAGMPKTDKPSAPPPMGGAPKTEDDEESSEESLLASVAEGDNNDAEIVNESLGKTDSASSTGSASGSTSSDSSDDLDDLSTYTDTELKNLYLDGSITAQEYNTELASRSEE